MASEPRRYFEIVVASLGQVKLLKQEDCGEVYASVDEELQPPDFRVVLESGVQLLVEVKNFYQKTPGDQHRQRAEYVAKVRAYADLMKCELLFATYWARPNLWTLVPEPLYRAAGSDRVLELTEALTANRMVVLGDKLIGTRAPLHVRAIARGARSALVGAEQNATLRAGTSVRVDAIDVFSEHRQLTEARDLRIASFLLMYGGWVERNVKVQALGDDLEVDVEVGPDPECDTQTEQGYASIGFLSSMVSRYYRQATTTEGGEVSGVRMAFSPGYVRDLVTDEHRSDALPLWQFRMEPRSRDGAR